MNVLVTGSNGQLGSELRLRAGGYPDFNFFFTDLAELDITDENAVGSFVRLNGIACVINCAAYTAVDRAEQEEEIAFRINAAAAAILARVCTANQALLVHISTDYVFDGTNHLPYREDDVTRPVSVYARSKHQGEAEVINHASRALVIRTSWLYSSFGQNFVKTILRLGRERDRIGIIFDQVGTPTYAGDLADAILTMIRTRPQHQGVEIYHYSNEGVASWYDFARAILDFAGSGCTVTPIETQEYPLPAVRPAYSVFNKAKIKRDFGLEIPYWRDSLKKCMEILALQGG
jgi:dTDP-4-dehydrorhamnose reductase